LRVPRRERSRADCRPTSGGRAGVTVVREREGVFDERDVAAVAAVVA